MDMLQGFEKRLGLHNNTALKKDCGDVSPFSRFVRSDPRSLAVLEDPGQKQVEGEQVTVELVLKGVPGLYKGERC